MRLQIALDTFDLDTALHVLRACRDSVQIAEVGTGLGISEGVGAIRAIKAAHPDLTVLSDVKIMDGGGSLAGFALDAGADIVTVLGAADDATVTAAIRAAHDRGKEILIDMIGVADIGSRSARLDELGADYICVHTPYDLRDSVLPPTAELAIVQRSVTRARSVVTGGITLDSIDTIVGFRPDVVVVGTAIMGAADPASAAAHFHAAVGHA